MMVITSTMVRMLLPPGLELLLMMAKEKPPVTAVGDIDGSITIIVDDIIECVQNFVGAVEILKDRGAYVIYLYHGHSWHSVCRSPSPTA